MCRSVLFGLALLTGPLPLLQADEVDDLVTSFLQEKGIAGLSLAVVHEGEVVKKAAYGQADLELESPARVDSIYEIGSITKMFTATAVMMLVEEGAIDLDATIGIYLDDLPETWRAVTVRQLLTHTSGIPSYTSATDFLKLARNEHTRAEILALVAEKPLDFEPGTKWAYCNTGYYLLGLIVEKAGGKPYARFLKERILAPLGMTDTQPNNPAAIVPRRASGYGTALGLVRVNRPPLTPSAAFSAGFLISTLDDLVKWDAALREGTLLKPESYEAMYAPVSLADGSTHPYGFGWATLRRFGHETLRHGGGTAGFSSLLARYPDDGLTIILLSNQADTDLGTLESRLSRRYVPALDVALAEPIDDPKPETTEWVRATFLALLEDRIDAENFTPRMAELLASASARADTRAIAKDGSLACLELLERTEESGSTVLRYRALLGATPYLVSVTLNPQGKIAGLRTEKVDP